MKYIIAMVLYAASSNAVSMYAGVQGGYASLNSRVRSEYIGQDYETRTPSGHGVFLGAHVGAGVHKDKLYYGIELTVDKPFLQAKTEQGGAGGVANHSRVSMEQRFAAGAGVKVGYTLNNWLPYLKGSFLFTKWHFDAYETGFGVTRHTQKTEYVQGVQVALGAETAIKENWVFGVEGSYSVSRRTKVSVLNPAPVTAYWYRFKPNVMQFAIRLSRKF